jgi:sulfopropanediol 3-dehydrogenase
MVACDLFVQADHDPNSRAILITTSRELGRSVLDQIDEHLRAVPTREVARRCWQNGGEVIVADDEYELVRLSDDYAIEYVEVMDRQPKLMIERLRE